MSLLLKSSRACNDHARRFGIHFTSSERLPWLRGTARYADLARTSEGLVARPRAVRDAAWNTILTATLLGKPRDQLGHDDGAGFVDVPWHSGRRSRVMSARNDAFASLFVRFSSYAARDTRDRLHVSLEASGDAEGTRAVMQAKCSVLELG
jgi:hypothetical protein